MAVVSLLKLEQFFLSKEQTSILFRKRRTPIFVFTCSVIIRASWLQLAITSFHFSQKLLENAFNEGVSFSYLEERQWVWRQSGFSHLFCLFVYLFVCLNSQQHIVGLDGTINISKQIHVSFFTQLAATFIFSLVLSMYAPQKFCRCCWLKIPSFLSFWICEYFLSVNLCFLHSHNASFFLSLFLAMRNFIFERLISIPLAGNGYDYAKIVQLKIV